VRLWVGKRVGTPLGPGRIVEFRNAQDEVRGYGRPIRGVAYAVVDLDKGGRRVYPARELDQDPSP